MIEAYFLTPVQVSKIFDLFLCATVFILILTLPFQQPVNDLSSTKNQVQTTDIDHQTTDVEPSDNASSQNSPSSPSNNDIDPAQNVQTVVKPIYQHITADTISPKPTHNNDKNSSTSSTPSTSSTHTLPSPTKYTKTITIGTDNPELAGKAIGYIRKQGSYYDSYASYYLYINGPSNNEYHSWAAFDLYDLTKWTGLKIKSARLLVFNNYMYHFKTIKFNLLKTSPSDLLPTEAAKILYDDSGSSGTTIGRYILSSTQDLINKILYIDLNSAAISAMNTKLSDSPEFYTYGIGMYVASMQTGYSTGYARWDDIKMEITFEYTEDLLKTTPGAGVAFGSEITGYVLQSSSGTSDNPGYAYTNLDTYNTYRSYTQWDVNKIKNVILGKNHTKVYVTKLYLRFNHFESALKDIRIHHMIKNVSTSTPANIFTDCGNGTRYYGPVSFDTTYNRESEWDLGNTAVKDLQRALDSSSLNFFGLGVISKSNLCKSTDYGMKLVIEWADRLSVYNMDQDLWYAYIQSGIDDANPGDTLLVLDGIYPEHVVVNKELNIIGESEYGTVITDIGLSESVKIKADNVKFSNFSFIGATGTNKDIGIRLTKANNCIISNNKFSRYSASIILDSAKNTTLGNNSMYNCGILMKGNSILDWDTHTIYKNNTVNDKPIVYLKNHVNGTFTQDIGQLILANCSDFSIKDLHLSDTTAGITIGFSNNNMIFNCSVEKNNYYGIYLKKASKNMISYCGLNNNLDHGIALLNSTNNIIQFNDCTGNIGNGIYIVSSQSNTVKNNFCNDNNNGILLYNSENNSVVDNTCKFNENSGLESVVRPGKTAKKIPIDVALVLDSSGSMSGQRMLDMQYAATNFINNEFLDKNDRVAIFDFGAGSSPLQPFTVCSPSGKNTLISKIKNLSAYGATPLWDKIGYAVNYVSGNGSDRFPIVIALTDGGDTSSRVFAPYHDWGTGKKIYQNIDGNSDHDYFMAYQNPEYETSWYWKNYAANEESRYGLLNNQNVTIHTVGLSLGHTNHSGDSCWRFPDGWWGGFAQYESVANKWTVNRNSSLYIESGTPEFNLWRVANTSSGEYFYAVSSEDLDAIFQKLVKIIKSPTSDVNSTFINNILTNNKHGIYLKGSKGVNITENNCSGNDFGLKFVSSSNENLLYRNLLRNNSIGVYLHNSMNNTIYHNNFIKNTQHSFDNGQNTWNATYPIGGNHWDTWTTPDNNLDGFVDYPYNVSGGKNKDYLPFAKMNGWENEPPTQPEIDVVPDFPKTDDEIICKITKPSIDRDKDTVYYIYDWYLNRGQGFIKQENLTDVTTNRSSFIPAAATLKHDIWLCIVTPTDGLENGSSAQDLVTVLNSPPSLPTIEITPNSPYTTDNLTCTIINHSTDLDNDSMTYTFHWYCDSGSGFEFRPDLSCITNNLTASILLNHTNKNEVWRCVVTPNDGEVYGSATFFDATILNSAPTQPRIEITPVNPRTNEDLVCLVTKPAKDADLDYINYTYLWYRNTGAGFELIPELTQSIRDLNASVPSNLTKKHDIWRCVVTPHDGMANGTPIQAEVTILNSPPVAIITSPLNGTIFNIADIAYFNGSKSTDIDYDSLTYEWDLDYIGPTFTADINGSIANKRWDDYFTGYVALRVTDDDGANDLDVIFVSVRNLPPKVKLQVLPTNVSIAVRIAGEKWHDIWIRLFENNNILVNQTIVRTPGSPNEQMFYISNITFNITKMYELIINYTPEDDPINGQDNGANPCWVILNFKNGNTDRLHHTFNVQHPETYNWSVDLTNPFISNGLNFTAYIYDNGPDEVTLNWDFGDGSNTTTSFYPNPSKIYPVIIFETQTHIYSSSGTFTVKLIVTDNHGGKSTENFDITVA